ncbi:PTS transporter subunit EIIC [Spiroplasma diminutum]|uniref:PTS system sucrose-specific IIABC component n=1 Tax=Spiroplasma diminutum CUAS-1 TaxID=1276221 RepID=S5MEM6_9MOLU|nr:PTS transporter subunit EIIC [Spiroplasma diminutum]AGR42198.1 PTS system sucrose-specific IIABC component [Spiroplasma diminutum CUAS-1]
MKKTNYAQEAKRFVDAVGGKENIESYLHCVTRLRFNVIDKEKVNIDEIKASPIAKGTNWTQNQLQIILGTGVVEAAYAEVQKLLEVNITSKDSNESSKSDSFEDFKLKAKANKDALRNSGGKFAWLQMSMKTLGDIFLPIIPAIVAAGLAMGVAALFKNIFNYDSSSLLGIIIDIVTKTAFSSLSVLVCWSTVKRFGGNPVLGIIIGLMLISPLLPDKGAISAWEAQSKFVENWAKNPIEGLTAKEFWISKGLNWMEEGVTPIKLWIIPITGYQGSVLPALIIGIGVAYLEKWIKLWMPKSVNIIFTPFLTILISLLAALFVLGPILLLVEEGVLIGTQAILSIPFGFGTGLIAGILQAIVITGCHQVLQGLEMQLVIKGNIPNEAGIMTGSIFNAIWTASIISQGGAAMAVALKAKSKQERNLGMSSAVSTMFGITEPAIFGVNLPKVKPFIFASIGGFIGGFVAGLLNVTCSGMGVTVLPGLLLYSDSIRNLLLIILVNGVAFGSAFALTFFFYWEAGKKVTEKQLANFSTKLTNAEIDLKKLKKEVDLKDKEDKVKKSEQKIKKLKEKEIKLKEDKIKYEKYLEEVKISKENDKVEKQKAKEEKKKNK